MAKLSDVAKSIRKGARDLAWISEMADAIEHIGSLEQAESEATQRLAAIDKKVAGANASLHNLIQRQAEVESAIEDAKSESVAVIKTAESMANEIITAASKEAGDTVDAAKADAAAVLSSAQTSLKEIEAAKHDAIQERDDVEELICDAQSRLGIIEGRIQAAKDAAAKAFAGVV